MKPYYQDNHIKLYCGDARNMAELEDESVQCVVTSSPYWGLRKYSGVPDLIWGGKDDCEHRWDELLPCHHPGQVTDAKAVHDETTAGQTAPSGQFCSLCGAWKGSYGLEPTPEMYIEHTIEFLREIRRVLRKDGVVFWNIGDSYAGSGRGADGKWANPQLSAESLEVKPDWSISNLKPKDLCLIPFRVAIAAQEDGWWVRSVIIWSKPNPMPESVTDRPTESHEYILMLTKSGTTQYWTHRDHEGSRTQPKPDYRWVKRGQPDVKAIQKEIGGMARRTIWEERDGEDRGWREAADRQHSDVIEETDIKPEGWTLKNKMGWDRINLWQGHDYYWDADAVREEYTEPLNRWGGDKTKPTDKSKDGDGIFAVQEREGRDRRPNSSGRNIRSVWEFPTQPYPEAHFAVFPEKLPETCIKATTPEVGCCSKCGAPWERVKEEDIGGTKGHSWHPHIDDLGQGNVKHQTGKEYQTYKRGETLGWQPTCKCNADKVPSIVLDLFGGAGTTPWVAKKLGRRCYVYELSREYCQLTVERCRQQVLM